MFSVIVIESKEQSPEVSIEQVPLVRGWWNGYTVEALWNWSRPFREVEGLKKVDDSAMMSEAN